MGRIGWADAHARRAVGDIETYRTKILEPLRADLLERTWLTERYDCAGNAIRAPYYHEYPELVAMLLREVSYGIELGVNSVTIDPIEPRPYRFRLGDVAVAYSERAVAISLPGEGLRAFTLGGMTPHAEYVVKARRVRTQRVRADADGRLRFTAPAAVEVTRRR
jgi:hypothetical protein